MSKKTEEAPKEELKFNKYPIETLLNVALSVPMSGDPLARDVVWGLPVLFWGEPGIGKSKRVENASARLGLGCDVIFPATLQPEDVTGVLVPDGKGGAIKICMLDSVRLAVDSGRHVIFLDEISGARPATQGALAGAVLKRQFGDVKLPGGVRLVAAANPPEQAAGGWEMEPMFANRFAHFDVYPPTDEEWVGYLLSKNLPRDTSILDYEDLVKRHWGPSWARSQGFFAGFHQKTKGRLLQKLPPEGSKDRGRAFPTPRTWEAAALTAATCMTLASAIPHSEELMLDFITALVGSGAATEFITWLREANLPNPEDVLTNGWTPDRLRIDRNYAVYTAMTAYVLGMRDEDKRVKAATQAYNVLDMASDAGLKDLIAPHVAQLVNRGLSVSLISNSDPNKKRLGETASRLLTKLGKTKVGALIKDFKE